METFQSDSERSNLANDGRALNESSQEEPDDRAIKYACSLEVDRAILLEHVLNFNWEKFELKKGCETSRDIDFARVNVPKMINDLEQGRRHDLSLCASSFHPNVTPVKKKKRTIVEEKIEDFDECRGIGGNGDIEGFEANGEGTRSTSEPLRPGKSSSSRSSGNNSNGAIGGTFMSSRSQFGFDGNEQTPRRGVVDEAGRRESVDLQSLRKSIAEHAVCEGEEDVRKLDESPLVKSMKNISMRSKENEDERRVELERNNDDAVDDISGIDNKFRIMELLLNLALDDIVSPTFSAFSESDFAELALEVWLCRTPTWSEDAISEVIKVLDIDENVGKTIANIASKCQGYALMEPEQSARTHLMSMSLGNVHRATDIFCPEIDFFISRSIAICEVLRVAQKVEDENAMNCEKNPFLIRTAVELNGTVKKEEEEEFRSSSSSSIPQNGGVEKPLPSLMLKELTRFISESRDGVKAFFTSQEDCDQILEAIEHALDNVDNESHGAKISSAHPASVAARAYYQLFKTALDAVEERSLAFDCEDTLNLLKNTVRFGLGPSITEAAHAALLTLFLTKVATAANYDEDLESLDVDEEFEKRASILARAGSELERTLFCRTDDSDYVAVFKNDPIAKPTLEKLLRWCEAAMSDYTFDVSPPADFKENEHPMHTYDTEAFAAILRIFRYVTIALGHTEDDFEQAVMRASTSSAKKCYERIRLKAMEDEISSENANDNLAHNPAAAAARVLEVVASEVSRVADEYAAHIAPRIKSCFFPSEYESFAAKSEIQKRQERADVVFPRELATLFVDELTWWLESDPPLTTVSLRALWASGDAQAALTVCCDVDALKRHQYDASSSAVAIVRATNADDDRNKNFERDLFPQLNVKEKAAPLIFKWIGIKIDDANIFAERAAQSEKWTSDRRNANQPAPSAVELLRLANETLEGFWGLGIPCSIAAIRALTEGIDSAFQRYAAELMKNVDLNADDLPIKPRLTRYKKDIVDKMQVDALDNIKRRKWVPENAQSLDAKSHSYCAKLAALDFILDELENGSIERDLPNRWIRMQRDCVALTSGFDNAIENSAAGNQEQDDFEASKWLEDVFASARQTLSSTIETFSNLLAARIVFTNMKEIFHDGAYVTKDKSFSRLTVYVVPALDDYMGSIVFSIGPKAAARLLEIVASAMLRKFCDMFVRITLDGGPGRAFDVSDARAFVLSDLANIRATFEANGDGLKEEDVQAMIKESELIAATMASETEPLIKAIQNNEGANSTQQEIMFRTLCHRAEHSASKFLKTSARLPKK